MTILILGGTGFFGKSISDVFLKGKLLKHNISEVIVLARDIDSFTKQHPQFIDKNIKHIEGDISTIKKLPFADMVIHAATSSKKKDYANELIKRDIKTYFI